MSAANFLQIELGAEKLQNLCPHAGLIAKRIRAERKEQSNIVERWPLPYVTYKKILRLGINQPKWLLHSVAVFFGFRFLLRASESSALLASSVRWEPPLLRIEVQGKADVRPVPLQANLDQLEQQLLDAYTRARRTTLAAARGDQHVVLSSAGLPLTADDSAEELTKMLKDAAKAVDDKDFLHYKSHSLRAGGATHAWELSSDEGALKNFGRWGSDAYQRYIRFAARTAPW
jgi:hypothetical protein